MDSVSIVLQRTVTVSRATPILSPTLPYSTFLYPALVLLYAICCC